MSEAKTVTINDKTYLRDSVTDKGVQLISSINVIDKELDQLNIKLSIASIARSKVMEELLVETANFTEAETPPSE